MWKYTGVGCGTVGIVGRDKKDIKNLAWATSFATRASRKFIYRASGEKLCHTLDVAYI